MIAISTTFRAACGQRSAILLEHGPASGANERPKSSRTSPVSQFQYWTGKGLSRPVLFAQQSAGLMRSSPG